MKVGELFVFLGFQVDDKQLKNFDNGIKSLTKQLDLTKVGAIAAVYAMDRFIESSVAGAVALYNFNQQTAISTQSLQAWQAAAHGANPALGVDEIAQSIQTLENNLVEIRKFGSGNASPFAWLKIDIAHGQNAINVLEQLRDRVSGLDRVTAVNLIQKMGLNPGFINILTRSRQEFDEFIKSTKRTDASILILERLGEKIAGFKLQLTILKDNINAGFAPIIIKIIDSVEQLGRAFKLVGEMVGFEFPIFVKTFAAGLIILYAALNPLKTLISGIILLLSDLYVYKKGGKSLIGEILGDATGENKIAKSIYGNNPHENPLYEFLFKMGDSIARMQRGEFKKDYREQIGTYDSSVRSQSNNNTTIDRSVKITNDISISHPDGDSIAEKIVRQNQKAIDQVDLNYSLTDQQYKGSGY